MMTACAAAYWATVAEITCSKPLNIQQVFMAIFYLQYQSASLRTYHKHTVCMKKLNF